MSSPKETDSLTIIHYNISAVPVWAVSPADIKDQIWRTDVKALPFRGLKWQRPGDREGKFAINNDQPEDTDDHWNGGKGTTDSRVEKADSLSRECRMRVTLNGTGPVLRLFVVFRV